MARRYPSQGDDPTPDEPLEEVAASALPEDEDDIEMYDPATDKQDRQGQRESEVTVTAPGDGRFTAKGSGTVSTVSVQRGGSATPRYVQLAMRTRFRQVLVIPEKQKSLLSVTARWHNKYLFLTLTNILRKHGFHMPEGSEWVCEVKEVNTTKHGLCAAIQLPESLTKVK